MRVPNLLRGREIGVETVIWRNEPLEILELLDILPRIPPETLKLSITLVELSRNAEVRLMPSSALYPSRIFIPGAPPAHLHGERRGREPRGDVLDANEKAPAPPRKRSLGLLVLALHVLANEALDVRGKRAARVGERQQVSFGTGQLRTGRMPRPSA